MFVRSLELWRTLSATRNDVVRRFSARVCELTPRTCSEAMRISAADEHGERAEQDRQQPAQRRRRSAPRCTFIASAPACRVGDAALHPARELVLADTPRVDPQPAPHRPAAHDKRPGVRRRDEGVGLAGATRTISPPCPLAATAIWPPTRKASPPNIRCSVTPGSPAAARGCGRRAARRTPCANLADG